MKKVDHILITIQRQILVVGLITMLVACFLQVLTRFAGAPIKGTEEVAILMMIVVTFFGASIALRESEHITIEIFEQFTQNKPLIRKIHRFLIAVINLVFSVIFFQLAFNFYQQVQLSGESSLQLHIPMTIPIIIMVISAILMGCYSIYHMFKSVRGEA
ncbi:TRAP-type C4-dicarboxylate transport system permease small subunit [Neobacillus niacini]|uniref:TRAP transporter small permease n=1 Tax=Neobacillus niacini TaxID=86668 RepID=UPI00285FC214|nr:TRAP transporter small permease subunit [Neobacillus niacini]MDR7079511.1 TRAP-type C4-dicarboxylate transport system permease small subunit [Neobacillus niacini]